MSLFNKDGAESKPPEEKKKARRSKKKDEAIAVEAAPAPVMVEPEPTFFNVRPPNLDDATQPLPNIDLSYTPTVPLNRLDDVITTPSGNGTISSPRRLACKQLEVAYASDMGMVRGNNEDSVIAFVGMVPRTDTSQEKQFGFFAVADGMGGHDNGEVASNMAVRISLGGVLREFYIRALDGRTPGKTGELPGDILVNVIEEANQAIIEAGIANHGNMGTTLTSAVVIDNMAYIGHIGDSRLYGMEKETNQLKQLTKDHSQVARLVEYGALTPQEARESQHRSVLYRSLGQRLGFYADSDFFIVSEYSRFLICSDGLWDMISDEEIERIMKSYDDPAATSQELIRAANAAGGDDNVSVVVVKL